MKKKIIVVLALVNCFLSIHAEPAEDFIKANRLYSQGQYSEALAVYQTIVDQGFVATALYYNMANAFYRQGNFPEAILYYEKAAKRSPYNKSIQHNLKLSKDQINSDIGEIPDFFLKQYWNDVSKFVSSTAWAIMSITILLLMAGFTGYWLLSIQIKKKRIGFFGLATSATVFILSVLFGITRLNLENNIYEAIIMEQNTLLMSSPDNRSEVKLHLKAGEKLKLLDKIENWYKVELSDKEIGWLVEENLKTI